SRACEEAGWEGCGERERPEPGQDPRPIWSESVSRPEDRGGTGAGGPDRGDGASAPPARGESGGDRAARQLHGDPAGERGVRVAREVAARAVRRVEQGE